jgi:ferritin-like protein
MTGASATRRGFLLAGAGALVLAPGARAATETDAEVLATTLAVEQLLVLSYRVVLASGKLAPRAQAVARRVLAQELQHADVLGRTVRKLGGTVPAAPSDTVSGDAALAAHRVSGSLAGLRSEQDALKLLMSLEAVAEGLYYAVLGKLGDPGLVRVSAEIMANEAQHAAAISELLHPGDVMLAVPDAYVEGTPQ